MHCSVKQLSQDYFDSTNKAVVPLPSWHFCDNEKDANDCADLVITGHKQATSPSLWWYKANNDSLPKVGDLNIVTNWYGEALCIIETVEVSIVAFNEITEEYARLEGEGDKSLAYWKEVHWAYYHRELSGTEYTPRQDMPIVCETFKVVYKRDLV